jgi:hypothetical protein
MTDYPFIQLQISRSGNSFWAVLVRQDKDGHVKRTRFGCSFALVKNYINRKNGLIYVNCPQTEYKKEKMADTDE